MMSINNDNIAM